MNIYIYIYTYMYICIAIIVYLLDRVRLRELVGSEAALAGLVDVGA